MAVTLDPATLEVAEQTVRDLIVRTKFPSEAKFLKLAADAINGLAQEPAEGEE